MSSLSQPHHALPRLARRLCLTMAAMVLCGSALAQSVVFINPGKSDEAFWRTSSKAMEAAARSLGMPFEVMYAERQPTRALEWAKQVASRPAAQQPNYVVLVHERGIAPELIRAFEGTRSKVMLAYSGIRLPAEVQVHGKPREKYRHWIGSIEPHAGDAGFLTAKALIERGRAQKLQAPDGKLHLLAISGDRSTTTSILRSEGMRRAIEEAGDVVLDQEAFASFEREKAKEQAKVLFQRHPQSRLVWAGNDLMAFGAMDVLEALGGKPGKDMLFSGINTSTAALTMVEDGRMAALAGGHFIAGAWALVLIYDYHRGTDFASADGTVIDANMFVNFTATDAARFLARYGEDDFSSVDFRRFSRALSPTLKRYNFRFDQLLR